MPSVHEHLVRCFLFLTFPPPVPARDERGDVPGWVLVTLMTAGLVAVIYQLAKGRINALVTAAFKNFTSG
jgi:hypothetical protein